jgi:predicted hydrolase (HD superfamily)
MKELVHRIGCGVGHDFDWGRGEPQAHGTQKQCTLRGEGVDKEMVMTGRTTELAGSIEVDRNSKAA